MKTKITAITLLLFSVFMLASAKLQGQQIPASQLVGNETPILVSDFRNLGKGTFLVYLNFFTTTYNSKGSIEARVNLNNNTIQVSKYDHFRSTQIKDVVIGNGTNSIKSQSQAYSQISLFLKDKKLYLKQIMNPGGGKLRLDPSSWKMVAERKMDAVRQMSTTSFIPTSNRVYNIEAKARPGRYIDVTRSQTTPGTNVGTWGLNKTGGTLNQKFRFVRAKGDLYYLESNLKVNMVVDVRDYGTKDGTNIQLVRKGVGTAAQQFKIVPAANGYVRLQSALGNNLYVGINPADGNVILRVGTQGDNTLFKITNAGAFVAQ